MVHALKNAYIYIYMLFFFNGSYTPLREERSHRPALVSSYIFQEEGLVCCKNIIFSFFVANISKDLFLFVFVCDIENNA